MILVRFLGKFASRQGANNGSSDGHDREGNVGFKDYLRHALAQVISFRHRVSHAAHMRTVSVTEALRALRSLKTLHEDLLRAVLLSAPKPDVEEGEKGQGNIGTGCAPLETALQYMEKLHNGNGRALCSEQATLPSVTSKFGHFLGFLAYRLLSTVELALQPVVKRLLGKDEYEKRCNVNQTVTLDLKTICDTLRRIILTGRTACSSEDREQRRKVLAEILEENSGVETNKRGTVRSHHSGKTNERKGDVVESNSKQLLSAVDTLAGPHGLRNALAHSKVNQLVTKRLGQALRASEVLTARLRGSVDDKLMTLSEQLKVLERMEARMSVNCLVCLQQVQPMECGEEHLWITLPSTTTGLLGRDELLQEILSHVHGSSFSRVILWGQPGIGKSALAIELALRLRKLCPIQFWLPSTTRNALNAALGELGALVKKDCCSDNGGRAHDFMHSAKRFIQSDRTKNLLIVVDDIFNLQLIDGLFPDSRHHVIFTTIAAIPKMWQEAYPSAKLVEVGPLSISDSLKLLQSKCPRISRKDLSLLMRRNLYSLLEERLKNVPLAVELAAGVLTDTELSSNDNLLSFNSKNDLCSVQAELGENSVNRGVSDTIGLLLAKLDPASINLLVCLSFLGQTGSVPCENIVHLIEEVSLYHDCPAVCRQLYESIGGDRWYRHLRTLQEISLIKRIPNCHSVNIHQLIQRSVLDCIHRQSHRATTHMLCTALATLLLGIFNMTDIFLVHMHDRIISDLLPMAESLLNSEVGLAKSQIAELATWLARGSYSTYSNVELASDWYRQAVVLQSEANVENSDAMKLAFLKAELGAVLWRVGSVDESVELLEAAVSIFTAANEENETDVEVDGMLLSLVLENLASAYFKTGLRMKNWYEAMAASIYYQKKELACNPINEQFELSRGMNRLKNAFSGPLRCKFTPIRVFGSSLTRSNNELLFWQGVEEFSRDPVVGFSKMMKALKQMTALQNNFCGESYGERSCSVLEFFPLLFLTRFFSEYFLTPIETALGPSGPAEIQLREEFEVFFIQAVTKEVRSVLEQEPDVRWTKLYSLVQQRKELHEEKQKRSTSLKVELTRFKDMFVRAYLDGATQIYNDLTQNRQITANESELLVIIGRLLCSQIQQTFSALLRCVIEHIEVNIHPEARMRILVKATNKAMKRALKRNQFTKDVKLAAMVVTNRQKVGIPILIYMLDQSFNGIGDTATKFVNDMLKELCPV